MWCFLQIRGMKRVHAAKVLLDEFKHDYLIIDEYINQVPVSPVISSLLKQYYPQLLLINCNSDIAKHFIRPYLDIFKGVTARSGLNTPYLTMNDEDVKSFLQLLQTPTDYTVKVIPEFPPRSQVKAARMYSGLLRGVKGDLKRGHETRRRTFYVALMPNIKLIIHVPSVHTKPTPKTPYEVRYFADDKSKHWYLLMCRKERYLLSCLQRQGFEGECLIPNIEIIKEGGECVKKNVMPGYYFVNCTRYQLETLDRFYEDFCFYIYRNMSEPVIIPDNEMDVFKKMLKDKSEDVNTLCNDLKDWDKVVLTLKNSPLDGQECTIEMITKNYVMVINEKGYHLKVKSGKIFLFFI